MTSLVPFPICKLPSTALTAVTDHMNILEIFSLLATSQNSNHLVSKSIRAFTMLKRASRTDYFTASIIACKDLIEIILSFQGYQLPIYVGNELSEVRKTINFLNETVILYPFNIEIDHRKEEDVRRIVEMIRSIRQRFYIFCFTNQSISEELFEIILKLRSCKLHIDVTNPHRISVNNWKMLINCVSTSASFNGINISSRKIRMLRKLWNKGNSLRSFEAKGMNIKNRYCSIDSFGKRKFNING